MRDGAVTSTGKNLLIWILIYSIQQFYNKKNHLLLDGQT
jgi:hypothetical protein